VAVVKRARIVREEKAEVKEDEKRTQRVDLKQKEEDRRENVEAVAKAME
jgi:hypothetical protein